MFAIFNFKKLKLLPLQTLHQCSTLEKLKDDLDIHKFTKNSEDIASFVRFNRPIKPIYTEEFSELYSRKPILAKSDHELKDIELMIRLICCEFEYLCHLNSRVPSSISLEHMKRMLQMKQSEQRQLFLIKSYLKETLKTRIKVKKSIKRKLNVKRQILEHKSLGIFSLDGNIQYGLWKNSLCFRFYNKSPRLIVQSGINAQLWNPVLAFDWHFPHLYDDNNKFPIIRKNSAEKLANVIFNIGNHNLKVNPLHKFSFHVIHLNLKEDNSFFNHLKEKYEQSLLDSKFFISHPESYTKFSSDKIAFYINPFAKQVFSQEDLKMVNQQQQKPIFIFSPYTELFGLKKIFIEKLFEYKQNESLSMNENVIHFRRLPIHDYIIPSKHLVLRFLIECLRDVIFESMDWVETLYKNVPRKYYKQK